MEKPSKKRRRLLDKDDDLFTSRIRIADIPCLMLPDSRFGFLDEQGRRHVRFLDLLCADFVLDATLPVPEARCCGSSHGWLVLVHGASSTQLTLFNPSTGDVVPLPSLSGAAEAKEAELSTSCDCNGNTSTGIRKIVLSSDPSQATRRNPCLAVAVFGDHGRLAFCRIGDGHWIRLEEGSDSDHYHYIDDVVYFSDHFYAVDECGGVYVCDLSADSPTLIQITPPWSFEGDKLYLVGSAAGWEIGGGLFLIRRYIDRGHPGFGRTIGFTVFELDDYDYSWHKARDVDSCSVFLGLNHSMAVADTGGCLGSSHSGSIYFTDDDHMDSYTDHHDAGGHEVGVFSFDDGLIHNLHCPVADSPAPTWVLLGS